MSTSKLISSNFKFWSYLIFLIPSFFCTLFVLYVFLFDRNQRRALNNHVLIVLLLTVLLCEVSMYPWMLYYYLHGTNWKRPYFFCQIWAFIDWAFYVLQIALFAWTTVERHILIFHDGWLVTVKQRFVLHYLPIILIVTYYFVFYFIVYFYPPCENISDGIGFIAFSVCLYDSMAFRIFETIVNCIFPSLTIVVFSIALLLRVLRQKQRMRQAITWRKHRKMTIQLLSISFLYLIVTCPYGFMILLRICGLSNDIGVDVESVAVFLSYYIVLLFPFVTVFSNPELSTKLRGCLRWKQTSIRPEIMPAQRANL